MRCYVLVFFMAIGIPFGFSQNWILQEVAQLPEPVANNAVCEGFDGTTPFVYSFAGIDSTLHSSGIHLKSWRFNTQTLQTEPLPDLPDTLGKVACGASRVGDIIYIFGGYHVFPNGDEISSDRVHRYHTQTNTFLSDGAAIPVPIDDHVQAVYKDSLIFLVTGWSNTGNVNDVQIYNTYTNSWQVGTETPNNSRYKCFGASGEIIGDTLYYFGGAAGFNFAAQTELRKGYINPNNPTEISWSFTEPDPNLTTYRAATCVAGNAVHWLGGSNVTYNYNGIAYNGSGLVSPAEQVAYLHPSFSGWGSESLTNLPMDLRGIGNVTDTRKYLMGGIGNNGEVSSSVLQLDYEGSLSVADKSEKDEFVVYPNPSNGLVVINLEGRLSILNQLGKLQLEMNVTANEQVDLNMLTSGLYHVRLIRENGETLTTKLILQ